tara:strand:+ start:816 stop:1061 length:246 start_codon:yes stop_codon:yes gene_type:complete
MTHSKVPAENGWKYFAINVNFEDHAELRKKTDALKEMTGKTKARLLKEMVNERMDQELIKMNGKVEKQMVILNKYISADST